MKMRTIHVITGLLDGGAEAVLYRLCRQEPSNQDAVVSLTGDGKYGPLLRAMGIPVFSLNIGPGSIPVSAVLRLRALLRNRRPDVVQTWMYHADLLGGVAARLAGIRAIIWGIHHTTLEVGASKGRTIWVAKTCARLSSFVPHKIVCCAKSAARVHEELGYESEKLVVVYNGYDLEEFRPSPDSGRAVRRELNVPVDGKLIGMVGRFHPQKDHETLLKTLSMVRSLGHDVYCLLVGPGLDRSNTQLMGWIRELGLANRILAVGPRADVPSVMNALDVHVLSSSYGEAFPNVLAEAMACGTPCVATDVGDAAMILGATGWVVPPRTPPHLRMDWLRR
jgi:glycosyltransferase involved in cell wall biosynthesis